MAFFKPFFCSHQGHLIVHNISVLRSATVLQAYNPYHLRSVRDMIDHFQDDNKDTKQVASNCYLLELLPAFFLYGLDPWLFGFGVLCDCCKEKKQNKLMAPNYPEICSQNTFML